jgi:hypothetical protein
MSAATDFPCPLMNTSSGIVMENSSLTFRQFSQPRRQVSDASHERMCGFFRSRHPLKTAECIEVATDGRVKARTAQKWFDRTSKPSFNAFLALISAYGAEFIVTITNDAPQSIRDAAAAEQDMRFEQRLAELKSEFNR